MKRIYLYISFLLASLAISGTALAQKDDIRAIKVSMITDMMNLTAAQSTQFWPVYNRYEGEMRVVYHSRKDLTKQQGMKAEEIIDERQQLDQREVSIKARYKNEFLKVVSAQQLLQMYQAEAKFKQILMDRMKNK